MLLYEKFYRDHGVRLKDDLPHPPVFALPRLRLPVNSCFHFTDHSDEVIGVDETHPVVATVEKNAKVVTLFNTDYGPSVNEAKLDATKRTIQFLEVIKGYQKQHPNFVRGFVDKTALRQRKNLVVVNHSLTGQAYTYRKSLSSHYHEMRNYWLTVFDTVCAKINTDDRQHFLMLTAPAILPSRQILKEWASQDPTFHFKKLNTEERFLIAEFWLWLENNPRSFIPTNPSVLERLNIIYTYKGQWIVFNLGVVRSWLKWGDEKKGLEPETAQTNFLKGMVKFVMGVSVEDVAVDNIEPLDEGDLTDTATKPQSTDEVMHQYGDNPQLNAFDQSQLKDSIEKGKVLLNKIEGASQGLNLGIKPVEQQLAEPGADDDSVFNSEEGEVSDAALDVLDDLNQELERKTVEAQIAKEVGYQPYQPRTRDLTLAVEERADTLALQGRYTPAEIRRFKALAGKWKNISDPYGSNQKMELLIDVKPEDVEIDSLNKVADNIAGVLDDSMLSSSLNVLDSRYIEEVLPRHMLAAAVNLQHAGICVTDYKVTRHESSFDAYQIHTVKLIPLEGKESTLRIKIPEVDEHGTFKAGGVKTRMRRQRIDLPIRKISHNSVALTSYVSKMFVSRSEKVAYCQERWLEKQLIGISNDATLGIKINFSNVFDSDVLTPLMFSNFARLCTKIETKDYTLYFDVNKHNTIFGKDVVEAFKKSKTNQVLLGRGKGKDDVTLLVMVEDGEVFKCNAEFGNYQSIGPIETLLGLEAYGGPVDMVELDAMGKEVPIVFALAYHLGLGRLIATMKTKVTRYPKGTRRKDAPWEYSVSFQDEVLVFDRHDYRSGLVFGGFKRFASLIKNYSVYEFDHPDVYGAIFTQMGISSRYLKELETINELWIDPITKQVLEEMGEPTDMIQLYFSAIDKLTNDKHAPQNHNAYYRDRGYERIAGFAYAEMVRSIRAYKGKPNRSLAKVEMNPQAVWMGILQDQTTSPVEESNPIHALKEQEVLVYRGTGGRSSRTMNANSRKYHPSSIGIVSEATVDNGDAATVIYTTADPNYTSLLGMVKTCDEDEVKKLSPTRMMNTSSLLAPGAEFDDPKRRNFISIQNSRTTNCLGSTLLPVRTGYERVIGFRTPDIFASMAKEDGQVISLTEHTLQIKYKSGKEKVIQLGKHYGKWSGKTIPHTILPSVKAGAKFKKGDALAFNPLFFTYDNLAGSLSYKMGMLGRIAFVENADTLEDSSALSARLTDSLVTVQTEVRNITLGFNQEVKDLLKVGDQVDYETVLCVIYDSLSTSESANLFDEKSLEVLKDIGSLVPKAKVTGVISNIEVIYAGEVEDMSESLSAITEKSDRIKYKISKEMGKPRQDGRVEPGFRVEGSVLELNSCIIRVYIDCEQRMREGSKIVVAHQMKSVTGRRWVEPIVSEDGQELDGYFGYQSLHNRIVESPELVGTTNTLLVAGTAAVIKAYRG